VAEPEDVIAEGALIATRVARELWARRMAGARAGPPRLQDVRRRLELFVAAVFPDAPEIGVAEPPAPPSLLARFARRRSAHLFSRSALASTDGHRISLPGTLDTLASEAVLGRYRLLALEQAARAARGTIGSAPDQHPLLRDLYLLAEAAAVDSLLLKLFPRLAASLEEARREAREQRPVALRASGQELAMEGLVRDLLSANPNTPPWPFVVAGTPEASRRWAEARLVEWMELTGPYRGMAPVPIWGTITAVPESTAAATGRDAGEASAPAGRTRMLSRRPRVREADEDEDDAEPGTWMVRADDPHEKAEDPAGLQRPADRDQQADPGELADALSELPEARLVRSPEAVREVLASEDPIRRAPGLEGALQSTGIAYPEWDWRAGAYRLRGAIVRELVAEEGDRAWVDIALRRHAAMICGVRRDFERLRPRRTALKRQPDGAELDVDAVVAAFADRRGGGVADDRFYVDSRPLRRDVAIGLLVDASASTDSWVSGDRRIIDVEKEALLIVTEALAALGDPHVILAFSGEGPGRVEMRILKGFRDPAGTREVQRRIAALEPAGYTRAGAAIRHATVSLTRQPARHRLLLLLSDGRPNDVDQYEGRYGIEDTRVAVAEARLQGLHCFCLTVDRAAPRYATRIFGRDFAVLSRAERLPTVLTTLLRELVRS
jgi:nitric oxide reductase NorD protein